MENYIDEGEATAPETLSIPLLSEEVKSQLQLLLPLLELDTAALVQDASEVRGVFNLIKHNLPVDLKNALTLVAYMEYHE